MKTEIAAPQFLESLEEQFRQNLEGLSPLQRAIREKAWDHLLELGLPERKQSGYQYLPLSQLYQESFELATRPSISYDHIAPHIYPESLGATLVFVNGRYLPELSMTQALPSEVVILPLSEALGTYGAFLQGRIARQLKEESDPFVTLNLALVETGLFVYVPPEVKVQVPVQCLHILSHDKSAIFSPRIQLYLGAHSELQWISTVRCLKDNDYFSNTVLDIAIEEGASLHRTSCLTPCSNGWYFEGVRTTLKRDSRFKNVTYMTGSKSTRQDFRVSLLGKNSDVSIKSIGLIDKHHSGHTNILVDHFEPNCRSMQHVKKVVADGAHSSFEGKIYVRSKAQKTEAYQLNNNLLLGNHAIASSKPGLEIFADDVKASHGATMSRLGSEELFYLKARGIPEEKARKLLINGYVQDIGEEIPHSSVRETLTQLAKDFAREDG
jgi:Fe-S cluster assembly protein SufD